jgi:hypothetical protein
MAPPPLAYVGCTYYTDRRKTKKDKEGGVIAERGGGWSQVRRQKKAWASCNIFPLGASRSPDGIPHLADGGSLNFHSAATTSTKRIPKGGENGSPNFLGIFAKFCQVRGNDHHAVHEKLQLTLFSKKCQKLAT